MIAESCRSRSNAEYLLLATVVACAVMVLAIVLETVHLLTMVNQMGRA